MIPRAHEFDTEFIDVLAQQAAQAVRRVASENLGPFIAEHRAAHNLALAEIRQLRERLLALDNPVPGAVGPSLMAPSKEFEESQFESEMLRQAVKHVEEAPGIPDGPQDEIPDGPKHEVSRGSLKSECTTRSFTGTLTQIAGIDTALFSEDGKEKCWCDLRCLEPLSVAVIFLNAVIIWLSLDIHPEWTFWIIVEVFFVVFFCVEIGLKLWSGRCTRFFFGDDWRWNWLDLIIIVAAVVDLVMTSTHNGDSSVGNVNPSMIRLVRLLRITRLVRLLNMKRLKDLKLMVDGVINGLQTLVWAFILLFGLLYILGVVMRQLMMAPDSCPDGGPLDKELCIEMFSTVFRSVFTVFRCFTDGCSTPQGTSLIPMLFEMYGIGFALAYILVMCFVTFGLFNLIMAVFVERTLENSKLETQKSEVARQRAQQQLARDFRSLVLKICSHNQRAAMALRSENPDLRTNASLGRGRRPSFLNVSPSKQVLVKGRALERTMKTRISRDEFDFIINQPDMRSMLDDLDIYVPSTAKFFNILDGNGDKTLEICEIAEGLMMLRGPVDKADIICASLMIKALQKDIQELHGESPKRKQLLE